MKVTIHFQSLKDLKNDYMSITPVLSECCYTEIDVEIVVEKNHKKFSSTQIYTTTKSVRESMEILNIFDKIYNDFLEYVKYDGIPFKKIRTDFTNNEHCKSTYTFSD